ncbi:hypothetical protein WBG78_19855 [Chryseolinea sp. T2]|uniref:hypothetical protein n=1 Tax=Chryseolinea sp. T2 TaxID=3129255 RepID=UPI0030769ADA
MARKSISPFYLLVDVMIWSRNIVYLQRLSDSPSLWTAIEPNLTLTTMRQFAPLFIAVLFFAACRPETKESSPKDQSDSLFVILSDEYIDGYLKARPPYGNISGYSHIRWPAQ